MPKGFHFGRTQTRNYTSEHVSLPAKLFRSLLDSTLTFYSIQSDHLSEEHKSFQLIKTEQWSRVALFTIKDKKIPIPLQLDNRSACQKIYLICPYCVQQRQKLYASKRTYACRNCLNLHYPSQSERKPDRLARRIRKQRSVLWRDCQINTVNLFESSAYWPKPKWMRWKKFHYEQRKILELEETYKCYQREFIKQYCLDEEFNI